MARLWSSGVELNTITSSVEWGIPLSTPSVQNTIVRSGDRAINITSLSSGTKKAMRFVYANNDANGPLFIRTYYRVGTLPSAENTIILLDDGSSTNLVTWITIDSGGVLRLFDEDGQIGSESSALSLNTQYLIEIQFDRTPAAGSQVIRARLNEVEFAGASDRSLSNGASGLQLGGNLNSEAQTTGNWYFDDTAINDGTGSFQNTYPGEGEIIHLRPNAAGDNNAWNKDGGGGGDANNFNLVDEVTPDDGTSNLETPSVVDATDDYNLDATPATLAADDTINCVQVGIRYRSEGAGTGDGFAVRIKASASGTVEESAEITPQNLTWITNTNGNPRNYPLTLYDLPGASTTAWTKATLDTAQIGIREIDTDGSFATEVSTLWLLVDHKPSGAAPAVTYTPGFMTTNTGFWGN